MAEMTAAARTDFLDPDHSVTGVAQTADVRLIVGFEEARPPRAGVELCARTEQRQPAEAAGVDPVAVIVEKHATEGRFGPVLEQYAPLIRSEARDDLRALRLGRRSQVELTHHVPCQGAASGREADCRAEGARLVAEASGGPQQPLNRSESTCCAAGRATSGPHVDRAFAHAASRPGAPQPGDRWYR